MMRRLAPLLFGLGLLLVAPAVQAVDAVATVGRDGTAGKIDEATLRGLAPNSLPVAFATHAGIEQARWTGALLWDVLAKIGLPEEKARLATTVLVIAKDGYAVAFSLGELDPGLGAAPVLLAWARDGADLPAEAGPRLVVPGDKRGARAVRDVARIELH
jgi:hypothetical protein